MYIVEVALDVGINKLFSYYHKDELLIGTRIIVKFRSKTCVGIVLKCSVLDDKQSFSYKLKPVIATLECQITGQLLDLAYFLSNYYHYPLGQCLFTLLPNKFKQPKAIELISPIAFNLSAQNTITTFRSAKTWRLYEELLQGTITKTRAKQIIGNGYLQLLNKWQSQNIIEPNLDKNYIYNDDKQDVAIQLNAAQALVVDGVTQRQNSFYPVVLYGITGSGKTEVYLQLVLTMLKLGKQALILVPEINLTKHLQVRFEQRFGRDIVRILTSNQTPKVRLETYLQAKSGSIRIIIGTRLAIFSEFSNLGIIIVDEEHDQSYKQCDTLRYNARDIAVWRAKYFNIPVILGSATPSLETLYNYKLKKYTLYSLLDRGVASAQLSPIHLIKPSIRQAHELDSKLLQQLKLRLEAKQLSLVFINRRGYAPVLMCYSCGWVSTCNSCAVKMVVHKHSKQLKCHYCAAITNIPHHCPSCQSMDINAIGEGTQKIEDVLSLNYPNASIARVDQDSLNSNKAWQSIYEKINSQAVDILVGTQILAKGHDFHNLTLVIGLNLDNALYSQDFRAIELLFSQLMQVTGRAGRGNLAGEVYLVTNFPEHYLYKFLLKHDFIGFANYLLRERRAFSLPPYCFYSIFRASGLDITKVLEYLQAIYLKVTTTLTKPDYSSITVCPPCPVAMPKLHNKYRAQILIKASDRNVLHEFLTKFMSITTQVSTKGVSSSYLDVDPIDVG